LKGKSYFYLRTLALKFRPRGRKGEFGARKRKKKKVDVSSQTLEKVYRKRGAASSGCF